MPKYRVGVTRKLRQHGVMEVVANNLAEAEEIANKHLKLGSEFIEWERATHLTTEKTVDGVCPISSDPASKEQA